MRVFKNSRFHKFARKEKISDAMLCEAVERAERGQIDADLGAGLIKQRVARPGAGHQTRTNTSRQGVNDSNRVLTVLWHGPAQRPAHRRGIDPGCDRAPVERVQKLQRVLHSSAQRGSAIGHGETLGHSHTLST